MKLEKHTGKKYIDLIERGSDFLGYHFSPVGLCVAQSTQNNFLAKAARLYEQSPFGTFWRRTGGVLFEALFSG